MLDQHSERELDVERQSAEPGEAASVSELFSVLRDAAEGGAGAAAGFVAVEPLFADEAVGFHVDVEANLIVNPRFGGPFGEEEV
jgi:hypothetical protein